jgi:hypothetical protein
MQEFESGQEVEVDFKEDGGFQTGIWIGMNKLFHVVNVRNVYCEFGDEHIRPAKEEVPPPSADSYLDERDAQIKYYERETGHLRSELSMKYDQIAKLEKHKKNLLSLRNIIYELTNAPYGHTFDIECQDGPGHNMDIKVRSPK